MDFEKEIELGSTEPGSCKVGGCGGEIGRGGKINDGMGDGGLVFIGIVMVKG